MQMAKRGLTRLVLQGVPKNKAALRINQCFVVSRSHREMASINLGDETLHDTTKVKKDKGESKGYQLPQSTEAQDDLDLEQRVPKNIKEQEQDQLDEELTYGQQYYILHREELLKKRREKEEEAKFGDFSARLVKRPQKNFLWGYGTQVYDENKDYFKKGQLPTIREIIRFLEVYQMKDVSVVNLKALGRTSMENYAIVCSGFSIRHLYSTAKMLCSEVKKLECPEIVNLPKVAGRKDDSWMLVCIKEIQVHLILDEYRNDLDLEFRWLNPPPQEMINKWKLYDKLGRRSANLNVNEETFKSDPNE